MKLVHKGIVLHELSTMAQSMFGNLVKAVVDITKEVMVVDAHLHADQEAYLFDLGSRQEDLWGINLYPKYFNTGDFIVFDSMINIRHSPSNNSRSVEDKEVQNKIETMVKKLVYYGDA